MAKKARPYRPKDANQLAKYIVELTTGERSESEVLLPSEQAKKKKKGNENSSGR